MLNKIANCPNKARAEWLYHYFFSPWESTGYKAENHNDQLHLTWNLIWASLGAFFITEQETMAMHENQSIRGDSKMKSSQIYLRAAASWVWLRAQSPRTIFNDSLIGNRAPVRHPLRSLIGPDHVTAGNPRSSWMVIAIVWRGKRIAIFPRFLIRSSKFTIVDRPLLANSYDAEKTHHKAPASFPHLG